jgi:hypothetical protein
VEWKIDSMVGPKEEKIKYEGQILFILQPRPGTVVDFSFSSLLAKIG